MLDITDLGDVGDIPVIGPVVLGIIGLVSLIGDIFGFSFGGSGVAQLATAVQALTGQVSAAVQQLTAAWWALAYAVGAMLQWMHDALVGFFSTLWDLLKKLASLLKKVLGDVLPLVLQTIRNIRDWVTAIYKLYILPIIAWLQYFRGWLFFLRLFHVKWATQLDGWLVKLQGYILTPFLYILRTLNGYGNWINVIISAAGLIQRAIFYNTMYAYQNDWVNMWWQGQATAPAGPAAAPITPAYTAPSTAEVSADLDEFIFDGTGDAYSDAIPYVQADQASLPAVSPGV